MSQNNKDDPKRGVMRLGLMKTDSLGESVEAHPTMRPTRSQGGTRPSKARLPLPHNGVSRARWSIKPMTVAEAKRWIERYNEWVEKWNYAEVNWDVPLSPEWADARFVYGPEIRLPRSTLCFEPRNGDRMGVIRLDHWYPFHDGWSFKRHFANVDEVVWAGWFRSNKKGEADHG